MPNELILIITLLAVYSITVLWYRLFGANGLMCFSALLTVAANIEVMIVINAFGMEQTLGNVLFAATFLITDILNETVGKSAAQKTVNISIAASVVFVLLSQSWLLYAPSESDIIFSSVREVFARVPRIIAASLVVYALSQKFDVWLYHRLWNFTEKKFGNRLRFLWLRNNASTLLAQLLNTVLFNLAAFWGVYDVPTLISIITSGYLIYIVTSVFATPFIYLARKIKA